MLNSNPNPNVPNSSSPYSNLQYSNKTKQEFSWLTDIKKVQAEIERDLEKTQRLMADTADENTSSDKSVSVPEVWFPAGMTDSKISDAVYTGAFNPETAGFYRETIKEKPRKKHFWAKTIAIIMLVCIFGMSSLGFGLGAAFMWVTGRTSELPVAEVPPETEAPTIVSNQYVFDTGGQHTGTVADMIALLEHAVVSITTIFDADRDPIAGSGTIFAETSDRIFIATGSYVVPAGAVYQVRIAGSRPLPARFDNTDRESGLAVISVDKALLHEAGIDSFTIASFGDSSSMQVGDVVFAIGNARNEGISVTRGIVSAGKQNIEFMDYDLTVLQTDAAINYGSSGGPLINLNGEVIGINIDRATVMFGNAAIEGIGYSIASNVVVPTLDELINPTTPGLGIIGRTVNDYIAAYFGIPPMGVQVVGVTPGGAAESAGIQIGDIITSFGGEPVFMMEELQQAIRQRQIGDTVEVRVLREGATITLEIELRALVPQ